MSERKSRVPASPKVRKFARELGLDINQIIGSKREGRVIENDVKNFVKEKTFQKSFTEKIKLKMNFHILILEKLK